MLKHGPTQLILYMAHRNSKSKLNFFLLCKYDSYWQERNISLDYISLYTCFVAQEIVYILKTNAFLYSKRQTA